MKKITLSPLGHTWFLDLDGTIVKHNGYRIDGYDSLLDGAEQFLKSLPESDVVIFITSRPSEYQVMTERFLTEHGIRYDHILYNVPFGERVLVNDRKPSGLNMAVAVNVMRDNTVCLQVKVDESL